MKPDRREFEDRPDGCHWSILDADGRVLHERTAPDRDKAYAESAFHYKLFDLGAHYLQAGARSAGNE